MNDVEIAIRVAADVADGARGLDDVGAAALNMADDVERAGRDAARSLDGIQEGVENVGSNASTLAGAFGDVAGGLGLIGLGQFSDELEATAPALMLVAGAADISSVAMNVLSLSKIKDTAATVANKAASIASATATKAQAAAQWALNAAMNANPIGLIILAVVALVGLLMALGVDLDDIKRILGAVGAAGQEAIGWVVDKVGDLVEWVGDKAPEAWDKAKQVTLTYFRVITTPYRLIYDGIVALVDLVGTAAPAAWDYMRDKSVNAIQTVTTPARRFADLVGDTVGWVTDIPARFEDARRVGVKVLDVLLAPIRSVRDAVKDLVEWIQSIDFGIIGDIGGALSNVGSGIGGLLGRTVAGGGGYTPGYVGDYGYYPPSPPPASGGDTYNFYFPGGMVGDEEAFTRMVTEALTARDRRMGDATA